MLKDKEKGLVQQDEALSTKVSFNLLSQLGVS